MEVMVMVAIMPGLPQTVLEFFHQDVSKTSIVNGLIDSAGALVCFFVMPVLGAVSDRLGRVPLSVGVLCLESLPYMMLAAWAMWPHSVSLWYFLFGKFFMRYSVVGFMQSYVSDTTDVKHRSLAYSLSMGSIMVPLLLAPLLNLVWGVRTVFMLAGLMMLLAILYALLVMPESLPALRKGGAVQQQLQPPPPAPEMPSHNPVAHIRYVLQAVPSAYHIMMCNFFCSIGIQGLLETILLYLHKELHFSKDALSRTMFVSGFIIIFDLVVLMPFVVKRWGEKRFVIISLIFNLMHMCGYLLIRQEWQVYIVSSVGAITYTTFPALAAMLSTAAPNEEQGRALNALTGVRNLTQGIGPLLFSGAYAYFTWDRAVVQFPQAPFIIGILCVFGGLYHAVRLEDPHTDGAHEKLLDHNHGYGGE